MVTQKMVPKVSVIMSVYSDERYVRESVESILNQTFTDFEFIIIDDGSEDSTWDILTEYADQDQRLRLFKNTKNIGLTRSLNKGLQVAQGEYIARQDSDDISLPERLEKQNRFLENKLEYVVVGSWGIAINEKETTIGVIQPEHGFETILCNMLFGNRLIHSSTVYRKNWINKIGRYNESFSATQDYDLWLRVIAHEGKIDNIPEFLIQYRIHNQNISISQNTMQETFACQAIQNALEHILSLRLNLSDIKLLRDVGFNGKTDLSLCERIAILLCLKKLWKNFEQKYSDDGKIQARMREKLDMIIRLIVRNTWQRRIVQHVYRNL